VPYRETSGVEVKNQEKKAERRFFASFADSLASFAVKLLTAKQEEEKG
jgi:hypothetical protein